MELSVEAVLTKAGSSVTYPVLLLSWPTSTAFSFSVPTTTGNSMLAPFTFSCARSVTPKPPRNRLVEPADHTIENGSASPSSNIQLEQRENGKHPEERKRAR